MKKLFVLVGIIFLWFTSEAQLSDPMLVYSRKYDPSDYKCVTDSMIKLASLQVEANLLKLENLGLKLRISDAPNPVLLDWPTRIATGVPNLPLIHVQPYFDLDNKNPDKLLDFSCGRRTYDGHTGTDIGIWPFMWLKMDEGVMDIVAAAKGIIVAIHDGDEDRSCGPSIYGGNYVIIQHADGSRCHYWHMKKGSVLKKDIGSDVAKGEYLGKMGSSGNSSGPHLHFVVQSSSGNYLDPHAGNCNLSPTSWFNQRPYNDPTLHLLTTHAIDKGPVFPPCPQPEKPNIQKNFKPGDQILFSSYFHDQIPGDVVHHRIIKPDGSIFTAWTQILKDTLQLSLWISAWQLPSFTQEGIWRYEATYYGKTLTTDFNVNTPTTFNAISIPNLSFYPNPVKDNLTINLGNNYHLIEIKLLNSLGQVISISKYQNVSTLQLNLDRAPGLYFATIQADGKAKTIRILKLYRYN